MENVSFKCFFCGEEVELKSHGGQYPTLWTGECKCGKIWEIEEISEELKELEEETTSPFFKKKGGVKDDENY